MRKKLKLGKCKLCLEEKQLNFEHIPPSSAFNKETKYYLINQTDYYKKANEYTFGNIKPKSRKEQGGLGDYSFCPDCNGFLGSKYVRTYKKFALIAMSILELSDKSIKAYEIDITGINLLKFLKQIIAIFIAKNNHSFTETYPELLDFVIDEKLTVLPSKYKFYMYLNNEGKNRNGTLHFMNNYGAICDFAFKPFGFVLNINNQYNLLQLTEITNFKFYDKIKSLEKIAITINKYPTYYPFPLDFRSKEELI